MVKYYPSLNEEHVEFITSQPLFFIASAPWAGDHINVSPKGHPSRTFSILGPKTVAYLDATGSGCETISHVYENGRATIMFCSFGPSPKIMRLFCKGRVVEKWDQHYQELRAKMATENGDDVDITGARAIIVLKISKVQTSCGFGVPMLAAGSDATTADDQRDAVTFVDHNQDDNAIDGWKNRETMDNWARKMLEKQELMDYQKRSNLYSLDNLPGLMSARRALDQNIAAEDTKAWLRKVSRQQDAVCVGIALGVLLMIALSLVGVLTIQATFLDHILNFQRRQMGEPEIWDKSEL
ncbi:hypothetical protein FB567DRAFT_512652 [Paraphoma chrysanthemicola]|uniref:Pyridoxamine 5'-phosphate oxidase N-terminal domain-containing protein n=1 Tax=Paraphoma chrysanthemicola TaxID=798071 RepID=A0A8K0RG20_9PLEO|nr:hypothetical protein FB567DRAFT_512652 [Paraphoma chrysanthemicola]